ncbi:arginine--tRNA ligase [Candidatus Uhrbacteria bacterium]|nr:arginine--tRNA ligase [Candidatus Uhrbacteria bacterium]
MSVLNRATKEALAAIGAALPGVSVGPDDLGATPKPEMGDLAFACFGAAKTLKKAPPQIAKEVAAAAKTAGLIAKLEAVGPYVNVFFDKTAFAAAVVDDIASAPQDYGATPAIGKKMMIEYGSVNTHKEVHVGHLRNVCLGLAAVNLRRAAGYEVIPAYYIGDVGAHVAKWLWYYRKKRSDDASEDVRAFGKIYTEATRLAESDEKYKEEIAAVLRKLEEHDPEWEALWLKTRDICLREIERIFAELGATFEKKYLESEVEAPGKEAVKELLKGGIAKVGEREAIIVDLEPDDLGIFLVLKGDGSALYSTKELALAKKKFEEFPNLAESVHIVDSRQSLYFKQLFATLKKMGFDKPMTHLGYEFVTLKEGAMSSRKGNIVAYEDFRDELLTHSAKETATRHADWSKEKTDRIAWAIAEGAMKFGMLKQDNDRPIVFDIEAALAFDGFTGPYIQYAHARLASILAKAGKEGPSSSKAGKTVSFAGPVDAGEYAVLRVAADLPDIAAKAAAAYRPSLLCQYLFDLAQATNDFYRDVPILAAAEADRERRLAIAQAVKAALARGLALLGIRAPDEM